MSVTTMETLEAASFPILIPGAPATRPFKVDPDAPARLVMIDLRASPLMMTGCDATIDQALLQMTLTGMQFALVVGADRRIVGSIGQEDIQGEKPMQYMHSIGCTETTCAWRDVQVENVMEPVEMWQVLDFSRVTRMTVAEVSALMKASGRRHMVVVEGAADPDARQVRGLFSAPRMQMLMRNHGLEGIDSHAARFGLLN